MSLGEVGAYAADQITSKPRRRVKSRRIKNGQVRKADVARGAVTRAKLADGPWMGLENYRHASDTPRALHAAAGRIVARLMPRPTVSLPIKAKSPPERAFLT